MKKAIKAFLSEADDYISGQELSGRFGVSRTAIWKVIRQLEEEGYVIEAVRSKGYRLIREPDLLTEESIRRYKTEGWAGHIIHAYEKTDSTNNMAKRLAEDGAGHGTLVIAEHQQAGRGRLGRSWDSPAGTGIWMSLLLRPQLAPADASALTLVMALAVRRAIEEAAGLSCAIKWPNDIIADGKKICGILTEMSAEPDQINHIVIGAGINVNQTVFPEALQELAASVRQLTGKEVSRAELTAAILANFETYYACFLQTADLQNLVAEYDRHLINRKKQVQVLAPDGPYQAVAQGINAEGALLVKTADGIHTVRSGEVSVRGVYGYV